MYEDSHLEMDYEDRYIADIDEDEGIGPSMEVEPDECPYCDTPMGLGHTKGCWFNPANRDPIEVYGTPEHEAWLIEMERREG